MGKRKQKRRGNIEAKPAYDPFPKSGLIKEYEPLIKKTVKALCGRKRNSSPRAAISSGTLLHHYLKRLHDWAQKEASSEHITASNALQAEFYGDHDAIDVDGIGAVHADGTEALATNLDKVSENNLHKLAESAPSVGDINAAENSKARDSARFEEERAQPIGDIDYTGGGNAARVLLDVGGAHVGIQLHDASESHVRGFVNRISIDLRAMRDVLDSVVARVLVAHHERRQREDDAEAEGNPTFLQPREEMRPHFKKVPARKPRRTPKPAPKRKRDHLDDDGWWDDLAGKKAAEQLKLIKRAAAALRPLLTPRQVEDDE